MLAVVCYYLARHPFVRCYPSAFGFELQRPWPVSKDLDLRSLLGKLSSRKGPRMRLQNKNVFGMGIVEKSYWSVRNAW